MNWLVYLVVLLLPVFQPAIQQRLQRVQPLVQQQQAAAPAIVFHEGRWWKYEGGQWWVWSPPAGVSHVDDDVRNPG